MPQFLVEHFNIQLVKVINILILSYYVLIARSYIRQFLVEHFNIRLAKSHSYFNFVYRQYIKLAR